MSIDGILLNRKMIFMDEVVFSICKINNEVADLNLLDYFSTQEWVKYTHFRLTRRKVSYICGRLAGKYAVSMFYPKEKMKEIEIENGIFHEPYIPVLSKTPAFLSIAHSGQVGVALASKKIHHIGIDLEENSPDYASKIRLILNDAEKKILCEEQLEILSWTAKEALSKVLMTGMNTPLKIYEIIEVDKKFDLYYSKFRYFPQYKAISMYFYSYWITFVVPEQLEVDFSKEDLDFWEI